MPSLERFFNPSIRVFTQNLTSLPGARLYFFSAGTTTPKVTYQDKQGAVEHTNPVIADSSGVFPQIFLDGLYRAELRSSANIVQPGWPIDNVGQDSAIVPFGPWSEIVAYNIGEVVTGSNGNWYQSIADENLGNNPTTSPADWEVIPIPVASSFTSDAEYLLWTDDGDQISLNVDQAALVDSVSETLTGVDGDFSAIDITAESVTAPVIDNTSFVNFPEVKTSFRSVSLSSNTAVHAVDPDLSIATLPLGWYAVEVFIRFSTSGSVVNGINAKIIAPDGVGLAFGSTGIWDFVTTGVAEETTVVSSSPEVIAYPSGAASLNAIKFKGMINNNDGFGVGKGIAISWAQATETPANPTLVERGYIIATRLKDL